MYSTTAFTLLALLASALAGPITYQSRDETTSCARRCRDTNKFNYLPGTTYEFDYNVQTHTSMEGASGDQATLGIRATADIEVLSKCDMALRLRDVKVYQSDPSTSTPMKYADESGVFRRNLERFPLRFSFQDGIVEELCPAESETTWALNIKRGLLTAVQNSMDNLEKNQRVQESDVTGECNTNYTVASHGWYSTTIKKTKDLLGCTDRNGYHSSVHGMQYRVPSEIQSLPLMKSTHECEQELDKNGLLKSALIRETHTFRPFSRATSGATTKILQRLNYKTQRSGVTTRQDYIRNRAGVVFEHAYGPGNKDQPMRDAESKLREICQNTREDIRPDTPRLFSELVYIIKNLDVDNLRSVYQQVKSGATCTDNSERVKKFFLDTIPMASTRASVTFLKEILLKREVTGAQATMWITSLSLIHYPTLEMLQEVKALLDTPQYSKAAMLPISTMVNNYCNHHEACSEESTITRIISTMEKTIGYGCYIRDSNLETSLVALRALGNAGHVDRLTTTLSSCFNKQANPMEVRVAAIQAYRRLPCTADRSEVMTIYQDSDEDSELRIAAYLAVMQCPSEDVLSTIQGTLESEKANQVGAFVWSHLTNLMETSSPQKQTIRRILEDKTLGRNFDLSTLKYSRNYEGSLFLEKFNTGAMLESNVIFSDKSFVPRSAMLNMTVDLFGNSLNLFELGGRMEGVEYLIENYLGPYSYFGGKAAKKPKSNVNLDHLRGDLYMRIFGNEMYYDHFKGVDPLASIKNFNFLDFLIKMSKKQDYSFTQSMMILDSSMIIPTSSGLPLNLTVNGTATIDLQASGQVDLRKMTTSPSSLLIDGHIKPSGAIKIVGTMSMDAFVTKTGLRVVNTWHSSTALKGRVELSRGKILSADIDFPQQKMEILDVNTEFFSIHGDQEKKQDLVSGNRKKLELCTGARLATITGLELCNEFQWPNASMVDNAPYFPFTGPFSQSLVLYKRDTHTGYKLMANQSVNQYFSKAQISVNTPGSRTDRSLAFDFLLNKKDKDLEINLASPWKKAAFKGSMAYESNKIGTRGNLIVDESSEYGIISEVGIKKVKTFVTYIPRLEIRRPGAKVILLSGTVEAEALKRASVELTLAGVTPNAISFRSALLNSKIEKSVMGTFNLAPKQDYVLEAGLVYQNSGRKKSIIKVIPTLTVKTPKVEVVSLSGSGDYKEGKSLKGSLSLDVHKVLTKPITLKCNIKKTGGTKSKYTGSVTVSSHFLVTKVSGNVQTKMNTVSSFITLDYNLPKIRSIKKDKITFSSKYTDRSTKSLWNYQLNTNFEDKRFPQVNFFTDMDFSHNKKHTEAGATFRYGPKSKDSSRQITGYALVNHDMGSKAKVDYTMKTTLGPLDIKLSLKGKHAQDSRNLNSSMTFAYGKGNTIDAALNLRNSGKRTLNLLGEASLSYPGKELRLNTDLIQSKKDYTHSMTFYMDKEKSTMVTTYKRQKDAAHQVKSNINLHNIQPIQLTASTNLDNKDLKVSAQADYAGEVYGINTGYKYSKTSSAKWSMDMTYPTRHVILQVEGGKRGVTYEGSADAKWDADKDISRRFLLTGKLNLKSLGNFASTVAMKYPTRDVEFNIKHASGEQYTTRADFSWDTDKKVKVDTSFKRVPRRNGQSLDGSVRVKTPFEGFEELMAQASSDNDDKKYGSSMQFSWGGKKNQISSAVSMKKPFSVRNIDLTITGTSPFKGYRRFSTEVAHRMTTSLNTIMKGSLEGKNAKLIMTGENRCTDQKRDIEGTVTFKSNFKGMRAVNLRLSHNDDLRKFVTDIALDVNGDQYIYDLDMNHAKSGWQFQNTGKLTLSSPSYRFTNNWQHRNTHNDVKSTMTTEWGRDKRIFVNIFGNHASATRTKALGGVTIETPWEPIRNIDINLDHEHGRGFIRHSSNMKQGENMIGSAGINYIRSNGQTESDFTLASPMTNLKGKINARYVTYPLSGHAELEWSPYNKLSLDGSFAAPSTQDIETSLRMTSPFENFRDIVVKASHKREGSDLISRGSFSYDIRKSFEFEAHITPDSLNNYRATLKTPFDDYKSLEAGLSFNGDHRNFMSKANFAITPVLGNFAGVLNWNLDDMNGKMRIDTPFHEYQYLQVFASSENTGKGRRSHIETEYYPRKTISLDAVYAIGTPIIIDVTIKTPFERMEHMSASLKHALRRRSLQTHADLSFASDNNLAGDLKLNWAKGYDGSLVITTPFSGYEMNKLSFRHEGNWDDVKSHGEIEMARKTGEVDLDFHNGFRSTGVFTLKTPFSGMTETKVSFNKRGSLDNIRGGIIITFGQDQTIDISGQNRFSNGRLDTTLLLKSPFSDNIKFVIDHDGQLRSFSTKVSGAVGSRHSFNSESAFTFRYPLIDLSTNFGYTKDWRGRNIGLKLHKEGYISDMNAKASGILDNEQVDISLMLKTDGKIEGSLTMQTPFEDYKDVGLSLQHSGNMQRFSSQGTIRYMDGKSLEGTLTLWQSGLAHVDTKAEIKTPFLGYESSLLKYRHSIDDTQMTSNALILYGRGQRITSDLSIETSPKISFDLTIQTPFNRFQNNKLVFSHSGPLISCTSHAQMEILEKSITADSSFEHGTTTMASLSIISNIEGMEMVKASFNKEGSSDNFRGSASASLKDSTIEADITSRIAQDIRGTFSLRTPFRDFRDTAIVIEHTGNWNDFNSEGLLRYMDGKTIEGKVKFSHNGYRQMKTSAELKTPFTAFEMITVEYGHDSRSNYFKSNSAVTYGNGQRITSDISADTSRDINVNVMLKTPFRNFELSRAMFTSTGPLRNLKSNAELEFAKTRLTAQTNFANMESTKGNLIITTNIPGYESMKGSIGVEGDLTDLKSTALLNIKDSTLEVDLSASLKNSIMASLTIRSPFQNFRNVGGFIQHSGSLSRFNTEGNLRYMDGKVVEGKVVFLTSGLTHIQASTELKTPFQGYESQSGEYKHSVKNGRLSSNMDVTYGQDQKVLMTVNGMMSPTIDISATLKTPFRNFDNSRIIFTHEGSIGNCKSHLEVQAIGKSFTADLDVQTGSSMRGNLNIVSNIQGLESMRVSYSKEGDINNLKAKGSIGIRDATLEASVNNVFSSRRLLTDLSIRNPYTKDIDVHLDFNGRPTNFKNQMSASIGTGGSITTDSFFRVRNGDIDISSGFTFNLAGLGQTGNIKFHKEGELRNMKMSINGDYNQKKASMKAEFRAMDGVHGEVKILTPFRPYRNIGFSFDHSGTWNRFTSQSMVKFMDRRQITAKINHFNHDLDRLESSLEINTPFQGYEFTKAEIDHSATTNGINCNAAVQYAQGQKITGELHATTSPKYDVEVKLTTPFRNYEVLSASTSFEHGIERYNLESKLNAGNGNRFGLESTIDMSTTPYTAVARLSTPFENFDSAEISLTHAGELMKFRSTGTIQTPMTGILTGEASLGYSSPLEMEGLISLSNDIKLAIHNTIRNKKYQSHIEASWSPRDQIAFDGSYQFLEIYNEKQLTTDFTLVTPFETAKLTALRFEHHQGSDKYTEKLEADYNGDTVLDMDMEISRGSREQGTFTMRTPRPMQLTLSGEIADKNIDGEMFVNWDRDEPESNIRIQTTLTDRSRQSLLNKDLTLKFIHPSRTVGIIGNVLTSQLQTKSHGEFIWNEDAGHKLFYDVDVKDRSRRYSKMFDGSFKVGSPLRSLQMDGSYSQTGASQTVDGAFSWDADRDDTKKIGMKAVLTPGDKNNQADLSLRLPSIGKNIQIDTEMLLNDGRTVFNGKTQVSYSSDPRKTLTLTSRMDDISYGYGNTNYSFVVGISHPYTDVDVKLTSHIGSSSEKVSAGTGMTYLTARRERKNFALRGEINKLRKQIQLQMETPIKNMELSGEMEETPFKLKIRNMYGDKIVQAHLTVDAERRMVDFQTNYDLDNPGKTLNMNARYVNSSAMQAEVYHQENSRRVSDSLVALRLNTSRLLHTRISWRPQMIADVQGYLTKKVETYGQNTKTAFHSVYESVGQELSGKYHRISQATKEELSPYLTMMESEMATIEKQLDSIRRDIKRMYDRNDFYMAAMGDHFNQAFQAYRDLVTSTKEVFASTNQKLAQYMEEMTNFPIGQKYQAIVAETLVNFKRGVDELVINTVEMISGLDEQLQSLRNTYHHHYNNLRTSITDLKNHPRLATIRLQFADNYQQYLNTITNKVQDLNIPSRYNTIVEHTQKMLTSRLGDIMKRDDLQHLLSLTNDAYQEGVWAFNYWQVEENLKQHLQSIYDILKEMVEEEVQKYREQLVFLEKSKVTVWDPQHGEIQIELYLPIPVQSLDTLPEIQTYVQKAKTAISTYIPDRATYQRYIPKSMWQTPNATTRMNGEIKTLPNASQRRPLRRYNAIRL
ncbi:uncharacterized protein [Haliotis cracherodii]|uniref:uncharacterized protein n=1 Tax=Haliotis cracherodii TaxID=6455 RepID=UPI0039ECE6A2